MFSVLRKSIFVFVALGIGLVSPAAQAATLATVINNTVVAFAPFTNLLSAGGYVMGFFLAILGIYKFKDHVDNPSQTPMSAGMKRFIAGGMFLSLPYMANVAVGDLIGGALGGSNQLVNTAYTTTTALSGGLDTMIYNFMLNIFGPTQILLALFCYIAGFMLLMLAISRLTKRLDDGPRGPAGMGTLMTFVASGAMFAMGDMAGAMVTTLFGDKTVNTLAQIDPSVMAAGVDAQRIQLVIEAVMSFVMLVGFIAFIRGWFVLKAFADGQQNATIAQGLTFLFGGALAINLGELVNILQKTMGLCPVTCALTFN